MRSGAPCAVAYVWIDCGFKLRTGGALVRMTGLLLLLCEFPRLALIGLERSLLATGSPVRRGYTSFPDPLQLTRTC